MCNHSGKIPFVQYLRMMMRKKIVPCKQNTQSGAQPGFFRRYAQFSISPLHPPQKKDQSHFRFTCLLFQIACARVLIEYRLIYFSVFFFFFFLFFYLFIYFIYLFIYFIYLFIYFFIIIFRYAIAYLRTGSYAPANAKPE